MTGQLIRQEQEEPKAVKSFDILLGSVDKVKAFVNDMYAAVIEGYLHQK